MKGKVCLITGATSGIGEAAAHSLARLGAEVIIIGRNPERCQATVDRIRKATGNPGVDYLVADLSAQSQVRALAEAIRARFLHLDVLVNNAGALFWKHQISQDGIEMTFALNHFSYFLLTNLLLEQLKASPAARIINVASDVHYGARIPFDDLPDAQRYNGLRAYRQSKLANILFTYELARRLGGTQVSANAMHPGFVASRFAMNNGFVFTLGTRISHLFAISPEAGARTVVYLAASPEVDGVTGQFFIKERPVQSDPFTYDREVARRLWQVSESLTG